MDKTGIIIIIVVVIIIVLIAIGLLLYFFVFREDEKDDDPDWNGKPTMPYIEKTLYAGRGKKPIDNYRSFIFENRELESVPRPSNYLFSTFGPNPSLGLNVANLTISLSSSIYSFDGNNLKDIDGNLLYTNGIDLIFFITPPPTDDDYILADFVYDGVNFILNWPTNELFIISPYTGKISVFNNNNNSEGFILI